jgi:hypothetical protein
MIWSKQEVRKVEEENKESERVNYKDRGRGEKARKEMNGKEFKKKLNRSCFMPSLYSMT